MFYSLVKKAWNSPTLTTWGSLFIRIGSVLFVLPLVLRKLAPEYVVLWQLFSTLSTLYILLDFGFSVTFSRMISFARGGKAVSEMAFVSGNSSGNDTDIKSVYPLVSFARWIYPRLAVGLSLLFLFLGYISLKLPIKSIEKNSWLAWVSWGVVLITSSFSFWGNSYSAILQGMDRIPDLRRWEILIGIFQIVSTLIALLSNCSFFTFIFIFQIWTILGAFRNYWLVKYLYPDLVTIVPEKNNEVFSVVWPVVWRSGVGVLLSHGLVHMSGLIYAQIGEPIQVASYLLALKVISTISVFSQAPFYSKLPRMAKLRATGYFADLLKLAKREMLISHVVFMAASIAVLFSMPMFLDLLNSKTPFVSDRMWGLMSLAFLFERYGAMHIQLYTLTNKIVWHIVNGINGLLTIVIAIVLYPQIQEFSFPVGMLVSYTFFYAIVASYLSHKEFKYSRWALERSAFVAPLVVFLFTYFCYFYLVYPSKLLE